MNSNHDQNSTNNNDNNSAHTNSDEMSDVSKLEVEKLSAEVEKFKNEYLYLKAEFENYKRHSIKERADLLKYGAERFIRDLLGVIDNFERALQTKVSSENFQTFVKGIELTNTELKSLLTKHSVIELPSEGHPFDPNLHEAIGAEPTDTMAPGHVLRVFQKPYKFHEKILRPGQVIVAKKMDVTN